MMQYLKVCVIGLVMLMQSLHLFAQDKRLQYPPLLLNSYFGVNIGYINYRFSPFQLEPGYSVESIRVPHTAVRVILFGHRFNKYLSAQISYMRPVDWVEYKNVNGSGKTHRVGMNVAGLTIRGSAPISPKISVNGEAGLGIITRGGFIIDNETVVRDAAYGSILLGGGIGYHLNKKWELHASAAWSPVNHRVKQPSAVFYSAGFNYTMTPLSKEKIEKKQNSKYVFPKQFVQVGYTTNALGYGVNNFVSKGAIPVFWGGDIQVKEGFTINYQRNIFHSRKVFSLDWGAGVSYWKSRNNSENFFTISLYPVFRFTVIRSKPADFYFSYSVAGPSFISRAIIDGKQSGKKFTFYDFMDIGAFANKKRSMNAGIRIAHYSNGNIFPQNAGVMVPLTFYLGYAFE